MCSRTFIFRNIVPNMKLIPLYEGPSPEMASGSAYCLKWNNHQTNILSAFIHLYEQQAFTDVTLACDDGQTLQAHKLVLAGCSSYFASLFNSAIGFTDKSVIVVLKDIKTSDMKTILDYMYKGEVNVEKDALSNLLRVADELRVKGLVGELNNENTPLLSNTHSQFEDRRDCSTPKTEEINKLADDGREFKQSSKYSESAEKRKSFVNCNNSQNGSPPRPRSPAMQSPPMHLPFVNSYFSPNLFNMMERRDYRECSRERTTKSPRSPSVDYKIPNHLPLLTPLNPQPHNGLESPPTKRMRGLRESCLPPTPILRTALAHTHGIRSDVLASLANSIMPIQSQLNAMAQARLSTSPVPSAHSFQPSESSRREKDFHEQNEMDVKQFVSQNIPFGLTQPKEEEPPSDDDSKSFSDGSKDSGEKDKTNRPMAPDFPSYDAVHSSAQYSNLASYVPNSRPEWKRYKQYTKRDLENAIGAVRGGMTALQASREHKVPSRTLYDKIKKMGISTIPRRLPKRSSQMDVDSTSDTPIAHVDVKTSSTDLFDQQLPPQNTLDQRSPEDNGAYYHGGRSAIEEELDRKRMLDHAESGGTTRGLFSVVERKVFPDGNSIPLDLTDHSAIITGRQQIEERA